MSFKIRFIAFYAVYDLLPLRSKTQYFFPKLLHNSANEAKESNTVQIRRINELKDIYVVDSIFLLQLFCL